mmetsp:Transcript_62073/g.173397  ORF Transcript_62073/g.173397 Transcript_62073/m.173397 type:complete len:274 (+) Transcript_62073:352-1173(+)
MCTRWWGLRRDSRPNLVMPPMRVRDMVRPPAVGRTTPFPRITRAGWRESTRPPRSPADSSPDGPPEKSTIGLPSARLPLSTLRTKALREGVQVLFTAARAAACLSSRIGGTSPSGRHHLAPRRPDSSQQLWPHRYWLSSSQAMRWPVVPGVYNSRGSSGVTLDELGVSCPVRLCSCGPRFRWSVGVRTPAVGDAEPAAAAAAPPGLEKAAPPAAGAAAPPVFHSARACSSPSSVPGPPHCRFLWPGGLRPEGGPARCEGAEGGDASLSPTELL